MRTSRNLLLGVGAYCASRWLSVALSAILAALARSVGADDSVVHSLLRSLASAIPDAAGAAACGIAVALLAESSQPAAWTFVPAALLLVGSIEEVLIPAYSWGGYLTQISIATLPAIVCVAAGRIAVRHRA